MKSLVEKQTKVFDDLKGSFGYTNIMQTPKIEKIVVSVGTGKRARTDAKFNPLVADRLAKIAGQKPVERGAKQSVAAFKIRTGDIVGYSVTLRGVRKQAFFDKLIHVAFPRTKDFRGINRSAVDSMGNLTIGMKDHSVFPETTDEDIRDIFGLSATIVTTAKTRDEAMKYFEFLGVPFKEKVEK
ncbi:MAG: large subunit ribosomal protein L5 [Planctomycetota bacterium]|jgi:large subunit ribosomal protein L5